MLHCPKTTLYINPTHMMKVHRSTSKGTLSSKQCYFKTKMHTRGFWNNATLSSKHALFGFSFHPYFVDKACLHSSPLC